MNRIRELRRSKNLTMKELGAIVGVSESTISLYENEKRQPDNDTLFRIADYFNVTLDYMFGRGEHIVNSSDRLSEQEAQLIKAYRDLNQQGREYIRQTMYMALSIYKKCSDVPDMEIEKIEKDA